MAGLQYPSSKHGFTTSFIQAWVYDILHPSLGLHPSSVGLHPSSNMGLRHPSSVRKRGFRCHGGRQGSRITLSIFIYDGWQRGLVLSQPPSVRGSAGFGSWDNPVYSVPSAPLWLDMSPWVWLSQIRWWYPAVNGGSSRSISLSSLWYPGLHWKSCRLDVEQQAQTKCRKDRSSSRCPPPPPPPPPRLSSVGRDSADIGGNRIPFKSSVRNLGVHLDQTLSMQQHISSVCRAAYLELRRIASIRPYLTQSETAQLVSSAVTSRLDYCSSILAGLPLKQT